MGRTNCRLRSDILQADHARSGKRHYADTAVSPVMPNAQFPIRQEAFELFGIAGTLAEEILFFRKVATKIKEVFFHFRAVPELDILEIAVADGFSRPFAPAGPPEESSLPCRPPILHVSEDVHAVEGPVRRYCSTRGPNNGT